MWTDGFVNTSGGDGWLKPWLLPLSDGAACSTSGHAGVRRLHRQDASGCTLRDGDVAISCSWLSRSVMLASLSHVRRWFLIIESASASPVQNISIVIFHISVCGECVCVCVCACACACACVRTYVCLCVRVYVWLCCVSECVYVYTYEFNNALQLIFDKFQGS